MKQLLLWLSILCCKCTFAATCSVSTTAVNFGSYLVFQSAPTTSTGSVILTCQGTVKTYAVSLNAGHSGSFGNRSLIGGGSSLFYQLYIDATRLTIWGDGSGGSATAAGSFGKGGGTNVHTIYGQLFPLQNIIPGNYTDSVLVTLSF